MTTPGSTWAIMFRPNAQPRNAKGQPQKALTLTGVARVRSEHGCMLFEGTNGEVVYAVPCDVVAYAGDIAYEATVKASLREVLETALRDLKTQGEA